MELNGIFCKCKRVTPELSNGLSSHVVFTSKRKQGRRKKKYGKVIGSLILFGS